MGCMLVLYVLWVLDEYCFCLSSGCGKEDLLKITNRWSFAIVNKYSGSYVFFLLKIDVRASGKINFSLTFRQVFWTDSNGSITSYGIRDQLTLIGRFVYSSHCSFFYWSRLDLYNPWAPLIHPMIKADFCIKKLQTPSGVGACRRTSVLCMREQNHNICFWVTLVVDCFWKSLEFVTFLVISANLFWQIVRFHIHVSTDRCEYHLPVVKRCLLIFFLWRDCHQNISYESSLLSAMSVCLSRADTL